MSIHHSASAPRSGAHGGRESRLERDQIRLDPPPGNGVIGRREGVRLAGRSNFRALQSVERAAAPLPVAIRWQLQFLDNNSPPFRRAECFGCGGGLEPATFSTMSEWPPITCEMRSCLFAAFRRRRRLRGRVERHVFASAVPRVPRSCSTCPLHHSFREQYACSLHLTHCRDARRSPDDDRAGDWTLEMTTMRREDRNAP